MKPPSDRTRYKKVKAVLQAALDVRADGRNAFLDSACGGDPELRAEVESLLASHDAAESGFLAEPVDAALARMTPESPATDLSGNRMGAYRLERLLGRGGMGAVYLASRDDGEFTKQVAIKVIRQSVATPALLHRFRNERQLLADIEHPNIARLLDGGTSATGLPYFIMEYVEGETLSNALNRGPFAVDDALLLADGVADALAAVHSRGLIFRDLKPSNVMLPVEGQVKILDFGIAKIVGDEVTSVPTSLTEPGWIVGSPHYMSPEQALGQPAGSSSDIFSFGVLLFETLSGHLPFGGETLPAYVHNLIHTDARELDETVPPELRRLIDKCLRKDPAERFDSGEELASEVSAISTGSSDAESARNLGVPALLAGATILILSAVLSLWVYQSFLATAARPTVVQQWGIATSAADERDPRISPDNRWVSYITERDGEPSMWLRSMRDDELQPIEPSEGRLTSHLWSPDGQEIAYLTRLPAEDRMQIIPIPGNRPSVTNGIGQSTSEPKLVRWIGNNIYLTFDDALSRFNAETGARFQLTPPGFRFDLVDVDIRQDEQKMVFSAFSEGKFDLWLADLDGGNLDRLTNDQFRNVSPVWSGEDSVLYVSNEGGRFDLRELSIRSRSSSLLTPSPDDEEHIDISTDGSSVVIEDSVEEANLWYWDAGDRLPRQITADTLDDFWPSVSASGEVMVFQRGKMRPAGRFGPFEAQIYVRPQGVVGSSEDQQIVNDGFAPQVSADGNWLAYLTSERPVRATIWLKHLKDERQRRVTDALILPDFDRFPLAWVFSNMAWAPGRSDLFFVAETEPGTIEIQKISVESEDVTPETIVGPRARPEGLTGLCPAPDGRWLGYVRQSEAGATSLLAADLEERIDRTLYSAGPAYELYCAGWLAEPTRAIVLRVGLTADGTETPYSDDVIEVGLDGTQTILGPLDGALGSSARLDPRGRSLFVTRLTDGAHNIYSFDLVDGTLRAITDNRLPSVSFSGIRVLSDGSLLYSMHERHSDIRLIQLER